jgi:hypothetical protein
MLSTDSTTVISSSCASLQPPRNCAAGFYVVAKFLEVPHDAPLGAVLDASKELCSKPWSWVSEGAGWHTRGAGCCNTSKAEDTPACVWLHCISAAVIMQQLWLA